MILIELKKLELLNQWKQNNYLDVMLRCKIECIPELSKNKNLKGIWIL